MTDFSQLIDSINSAGRLEDILRVSNWKEDYKKLMLLIHPDVCHLPGASKAATRLNLLKSRFEKGSEFTDDAGTFCTNGSVTVFDGDTDLLNTSYRNYLRVRSAATSHLIKYLPKEMQWDGRRLTVTHNNRCLPLSGLRLPQEHVNWVLSRLLEFTTLLNGQGIVHCGLTPESLFITPETHGIEVVSFYHTTPANRKISTISGQYKTWYPDILFKRKAAEAYIDITLCKKIAVYLLGDHSGCGVKLKKTHNEAFIDLVTTLSDDPFETYDRYRALLRNNFKKVFHILNL